LTDSEGHIGRTHRESRPWYEAKPKPQAGSPNIIFVVLDDVGYADLGCYGSEIRTPNIDRLAEQGLRYSNFHTTTLCSPTRACLLTGRNHHAVGMRYLANVDMGWPSGRGAISHRAATIAEILRETGYASFAVGKWHVAPTDEASAAGPFGQWPLGRGFDRFYGFMNGSTDQFHPELVEDNRPTDPPARPEDGYHLSKDLVDRAIGMLANHISLVPDRPFFMNFAFGAGHFPHQVPAEYMARYDGVYDVGWEEIRRRRLARQKRIGLVPDATELPASNPGVEEWQKLSADQKRVGIRLQQAYAGFLEHTDEQFGRLLSFLERTGVRENTLIVLISDNGASIDCGPDGTTNVLRWFNQIPDTLERNLADLERIGGPNSNTNYPWGWAQASNTPLRLYKSFTHGGGVRDPLIVSWPKRIAQHGGVRHQFHHVVDIVPTVLECCGLSAPGTHKGIEQLPIHGTSFAYSFDAPNEPTRKDVQYFEMYGHRSIWHRGWKAVTNHIPGSEFDLDAWELYHLEKDFAETNDLAKVRPDKLRELVELWWAEAAKYDVLPLDDRRDILFRPSPKPDSIRARKRFVYYPEIAAIPAEAAPLTQDVSHSIRVELTCRDGDAGTLLCFGTLAGGYVLFARDGRVTYAYNHCGEITRIVSTERLQPGRRSVEFTFRKTGVLAGAGSLSIDGQAAGEQVFAKTLLRTSLAPLYLGRSGLPPVVDDYEGEFRFTGEIERVTFEIGDDRELAPAGGDVD
jgi:arylsulfatase A-like enzyme